MLLARAANTVFITGMNIKANSVICWNYLLHFPWHLFFYLGVVLHYIDTA